jgi:hypothetical protein
MTLPQLLAENIPVMLRVEPRWVLAKFISTPKGVTKVPYRVDRPSDCASTTDSRTWNTFAAAVNAYWSGAADGIGFVLGDRFTGLDFDHCVQDGRLSPEVRRHLDRLQSYSEESVSGTGIHTIVLGQKPGQRCKKNGCELYSESRYFVMTGHRLRDYPESVEERSMELAAVYHEIFGPDAEPALSSPSASVLLLTDAEVLALAMRAKNGDRFAALWAGDTSRYYGDDSAADLALCNLLAFYTQQNADQMDRLFRASGLMRHKWDSRRNDSTYGADTIARAIRDVRTTYTPAADPIELETEAEDDAVELIESSAWPTLADDALVGLFGEFVQAVSPHTEADPVGLLAHALVLFGNLIGRRPQVAVGDDLHHLNENILVIGDTSTGRKGMALNAAKALYADVDPDWMTTRLMAGLSSGEGLIYVVRDPLISDDEIVDTGVADKRLTVVETEFAKVLRVSRRENNTLSTILRQCWDDGSLRVMTRNSPLTSTGAHVSVIGHITPLELRQELKTTDMASGFINRFVLMLVKRRHLLPVGGRIDDTQRAALVTQFTAAATAARDVEVLARNDDAKAHWVGIYEHLTRARLGLVGAICNRAPAHVLRLSALYALAEGSSTIQRQHQQAALAVWEYAEASATMIFGQRVGHRLANFLLELMRSEPTGVTRTQIRDALGRHRHADEISEALQLLKDLGLATCVKEPGPGRPTVRWTAESAT